MTLMKAQKTSLNLSIYISAHYSISQVSYYNMTLQYGKFLPLLINKSLLKLSSLLTFIDFVS